MKGKKLNPFEVIVVHNYERRKLGKSFAESFSQTISKYVFFKNLSNGEAMLRAINSF